MKISSSHIRFAMSLAALFLVAISLSKPGSARRAGQMPANDDGTATPSIAALLNPDGSLNLKSGLAGSFDAKGYQMEFGPNGEPRFTTAAAAQAAGCTDNWAEGFHLPGTNGGVSALVVDSSGNLYIGGSFTSVGGLAANYVAKWDGKIWSSLAGGLNYFVTALAVIGNDLYVGGYFNEAENSSGAIISANNVAKWDGSAWSALGDGSNVMGNGVNRFVRALAVSGTDLYVGGGFGEARTNAGSKVAASSIAKWNGSSWSALGDGSFDLNNGTDDVVYALAVSGDDLYVGGNFLQVRNSSSSTLPASRIAKWNGSAWAVLGNGSGVANNGLNGHVAALAVSGTNLYVGGGFNEVRINAGSVVKASYIAKWNGAAWSALGDGSAALNNGTNAEVNTLIVNGNDLFVGGTFFQVRNSSNSTVPASRIAKWNGSLWTALGDGTSEQANGIGQIAGVFTPSVLALAVAKGELYVGGGFSQAVINAGTIVRTTNIAKWNGSIWSTPFKGNGVGSSNASSEALSETINCVAVDSVGNVYVGGRFTGAGNVAATNIAKWNGSSWSALGNGSALEGNGVNGQVLALAVIGNDLYVGGLFNQARNGPGQNVLTSNIARWDGRFWLALGDASQATSNGLNSTVLTLAAIGTDLYVGGVFNQARNSGSSVIATSRIAKWDGRSWSALGNGGTASGNGVSNLAGEGTVYVLAASGTDLYVGGDFTQARNNSNSTVPASRIAKWNGSSWFALGDATSSSTNGADKIVFALAVSKGDLYVGGSFGEVRNGVNSSIPASSIAKWNGSSWSALGDAGVSSGNGVNNPVQSLAVSGNDLYVGGRFTQVRNSISSVISARDIARWNGEAWFEVDGGVTGLVLDVVGGQPGDTVLALAAGKGFVYAGGIFRAVGCRTSNLFAIYNGVDLINPTLTDPLSCTQGGNRVTSSATIENRASAPRSTNYVATLPPQLIGLPGSCIASNGTPCTVSATSVSWNGTVAANSSVTITYQTQIADGLPAGTQVCVESTAIFASGAASAEATACITLNCPTVGPGSLLTATAPISDQRPGSVLLYNVYTSATDPTLQNTRINITNTHPSLPATVHLFFVDGATCSVADSFLCLTPNQTASFLASDLDPGTTGYIVAVAIDDNGCPANLNYLIGDEYVKFASGHAANLAAGSFASIAGGLPICDTNSVTAQLNFDGVSYSLAPRVLALDNIGSRADGNDTLLILNRLGGNLGTGTNLLGIVFGILYDDQEAGLSFSFAPSACQFRGVISSNFPRTAPRFEQFISAGRSGWMKFYAEMGSSGEAPGMMGAAINANTNAATIGGAFNQGHNLHALTLTATVAFTIPVFPPGC